MVSFVQPKSTKFETLIIGWLALEKHGPIIFFVFYKNG